MCAPAPRRRPRHPRGAWRAGLFRQRTGQGVGRPGPDRVFAATYPLLNTNGAFGANLTTTKADQFKTRGAFGARCTTAKEDSSKPRAPFGARFTTAKEVSSKPGRLRRPIQSHQRPAVHTHARSSRTPRTTAQTRKSGIYGRALSAMNLSRQTALFCVPRSAHRSICSGNLRGVCLASSTS